MSIKQSHFELHTKLGSPSHCRQSLLAIVNVILVRDI